MPPLWIYGRLRDGRQFQRRHLFGVDFADHRTAMPPGLRVMDFALRGYRRHSKVGMSCCSLINWARQIEGVGSANKVATSGWGR